MFVLALKSKTVLLWIRDALETILLILSQTKRHIRDLLNDEQYVSGSTITDVHNNTVRKRATTHDVTSSPLVNIRKRETTSLN